MKKENEMNAALAKERKEKSKSDLQNARLEQQLHEL